MAPSPFAFWWLLNHEVLVSGAQDHSWSGSRGGRQGRTLGEQWGAGVLSSCFLLGSIPPSQGLGDPGWGCKEWLRTQRHSARERGPCPVAMPAWNLSPPGLCWVGEGEGCCVGLFCPLQGGHSRPWGGWRDKGLNRSQAAPAPLCLLTLLPLGSSLGICPPTPGCRLHLFSPGPLEATPLQPTLNLLQGPLTTVPDAAPAIGPCHHLQHGFLWPTSWPGK